MLERLARRPAFWIAALALLARVLPSPRTIDDAFITFRYARNLLDGLGFVYNPGARVLGTTTPLFTLLLAGLSFLLRTENYPWLALAVNALADAVTCALLVPLGERLSGRREVGIAAGLLWAVAPMSVTFAIGGMETSVFILLTIGTFALYHAGRTRLAALAAALSLLTRPDALLFVGPLALDLAARRMLGRGHPRTDTNTGEKSASVRVHPRPSFPFAEAGVFLATLAPWTVFATLYFGSPFTHSVAAKTVAYRLPATSALFRLTQHYATPFFEHLAIPSAPVLIALLIVYLALAVIAGTDFIRRDSRAWPLVLYPLIYFVTFAVANPLIFRWYLAPPLPAYFLLILGGIHRLIADVFRGLPRQRPTPPASASDLRPPTSDFPPLPLLLAPYSLLLLFSLNAWTLHPDHGPDRPAPQMAWHQLELLYERVGRGMAPQVSADTVIAAGDVGALGYYSGARILDMVGLMSPEAVAYYPLPDSFYTIAYAIAPDLVLDHRPDYVVLLEVYGREGLLKDPRFRTRYALIETVPTDIYGSRGLLIFERGQPALSGPSAEP